MSEHLYLKQKILSAAGLILAVCFLIPTTSSAQVKWINVDSLYAPLPASLQVFKTTDSLDGKPFIAYYTKARLKDKSLNFTVDTTKDRRLTPLQFYERDDIPLLVVNCTFFSYETNRSLNVVIRNGKMLAFNNHSIPMKGKDTFQYRHPFTGAIGINKNRKADIAWLYTDSTKKYPLASQDKITPIKDSIKQPTNDYLIHETSVIPYYHATPSGMYSPFKKWKVKTAVGGGPVLLQNGRIDISNEEDLRFAGKAINDKHPRTCMGYTNDGYLIVMVIEGRFPGIAEGATLEQEARLMIGLGCNEALNLDGGGSSCMLINGKETIKPSEKGIERPVPAVFLIQQH